MTSGGNNFNDYPESAYYTTNRQFALGLMFAEFKGGGSAPSEYAPDDLTGTTLHD